MCVTESLCCIAEIDRHNTVNQLYSNKNLLITYNGKESEKLYLYMYI